MMMNSKNHKAFVDQHVPRESKTGDDGWTEHRHDFLMKHMFWFVDPFDCRYIYHEPYLTYLAK